MNLIIGGIILLAIAVIAMLIYLIINTPIFTVQEQQAVVIERLGKFKRVCGPGWHACWPFIDKKRKFREGGVEHEFIDQRERAVDLPEQDVITKDNVQVQVDSMAYYEISDPKKAVYGVDDVLVAVNNLIKTVLRNVIGDTTLQEMLSGREAINRRLRDQVENASGDWGITIRSVELQAVTPPPSYVEAMRKVSEAELAKKAEVTRAEGKKQASILEAEGEAEKIDRIYKAIHNGKPTEDLLKIKYLEALEKIADGKANKVFMPFPSNPSNPNFNFQQAFGMAAGLDAYSSASSTPSQESPPPPPPQAATESPTTPVSKEQTSAPGEQPQPGGPQKKIIRRVVKRPASEPETKKS